MGKGLDALIGLTSRFTVHPSFPVIMKFFPVYRPSPRLNLGTGLPQGCIERHIASQEAIKTIASQSLIKSWKHVLLLHHNNHEGFADLWPRPNYYRIQNITFSYLSWFWHPNSSEPIHQYNIDLHWLEKEPSGCKLYPSSHALVPNKRGT